MFILQKPFCPFPKNEWKMLKCGGGEILNDVVCVVYMCVCVCVCVCVYVCVLYMCMCVVCMCVIQCPNL